jgi:predicted DNA-binding transcriptional regulator AlpA
MRKNSSIPNALPQPPSPAGNLPLDLVDATDLASIFGVSRQTIFNWVKAGHLPRPLRLGADGQTCRWTRASILHFLEEKGMVADAV